MATFTLTTKCNFALPGSQGVQHISKGTEYTINVNQYNASASSLRQPMFQQSILLQLKNQGLEIKNPNQLYQFCQIVKK